MFTKAQNVFSYNFAWVKRALSSIKVLESFDKQDKAWTLYKIIIDSARKLNKQPSEEQEAIMLILINLQSTTLHMPLIHTCGGFCYKEPHNKTK